jgi:hypothetical protein
MSGRKLYIKQSALKHHINIQDISCAVDDCRYDEIMEGFEEKRLLLGFDTQARLLEIMYNEIDEQTYRIFHADRCRPAYEKLLPQ